MECLDFEPEDVVAEAMSLLAMMPPRSFASIEASRAGSELVRST
jgi:hypothetical protein